MIARLTFKSPAELDKKEMLARLDLTKYRAMWMVDGDGTEREVRMIRGRDCIVSIVHARDGCLAGKYMAVLELRGDMGGMRPKGWPRFYFDQHRAMEEVEAWLDFNGQITTTQTTES